jgi:two-component system, NarL family, response regulator YdfI
MKHQKRAREEATRKNEPRRLRILVASSLPQTATSITGLLRKHPDLEVIVSSGGSAALQNALQDIDPDVLIFDGDEHEAASVPKFTELAEAIPTILLVHEASASWIRQALQAGIRGLLPYGASADELAAAIRAVASDLLALGAEFSEVIFPSSAPADSEEFEFPFEPLTPREQEVLAMLAEGLLNKEIAGRLKISEHTVKFHISSIMGKLGASSRTEAVMRGIRRGLLYV